jgi:hypothetical protein
MPNDPRTYAVSKKAQRAHLLQRFLNEILELDLHAFNPGDYPPRISPILIHKSTFL